MRVLLETTTSAIGVDDGCIVPPDGHFDVSIQVGAAHITPGLINAHDHLHRNHYGRLGAPPYANAYEWGRDIHLRHAGHIARGRAMPRRRALLRGAWKNLVAGVTTVVHHDPWEADFDDDFPIRVAPLRSAHSLRLETSFPSPGLGDEPFAIHLAEGTDAAAADEVRELDDRGLLTSDTLAVHMVGPDADGIARFRGRGSGVVWCPSSNLFLFGRTAPAELLAPGIDVLLGSDSLLTGAGTLLDEIQVARRLGLLDDDRLLGAVGDVAARRLNRPAPSLAVGAPADLVLWRRPPLEARARDVALVMVGGVIRVLDPTLLGSLGGYAESGRTRKINGLARWVNQGSTAPRISRQPRRL